MRRLMALLGLAGLALATALVVREGAGAVLGAVFAAGWGLALVVLYDAVPLFVDAAAWRCLVPGDQRPSLARVMGARWIRQSVNQLLPVLQVGGDVVGARMLHLAGVGGADAGASVVVDLTLSVATQALFTLAGVALLLALFESDGLIWPVLGGTALLVAGLSGFVIAQRKGLFRFLARYLEKASGGMLAFVGSAEALDQAVRAIHARPRALWRNVALQLVGWVLGVGETWLACWVLGHPIGLIEAFILQSLVRAVRSAAFPVPAGIGVQEGSLMLLAGIVGLSPETGLAVALVKRLRELAGGVPALIAWQVIEGGRLWRRRTAG
jgi:putative membrane protein